MSTPFSQEKKSIRRRRLTLCENIDQIDLLSLISDVCAGARHMSSPYLAVNRLNSIWSKTCGVGGG